jgi:hypothetical protein
LTGASYHLHQLKALFQDCFSDNQQMMIFHWCLRSFFWELVAVRHSVRREPKTDTSIWMALNALKAAPWFSEINEYRNFVPPAPASTTVATKQRIPAWVDLDGQCQTWHTRLW